MKKIKICNNCNKVLPYDSSFCQYCGSNDIKETVIEDKLKCKKCGALVPSDSEFCPYCGSNEIGIVNNSSSVSNEHAIPKENLSSKNNNFNQHSSADVGTNKNPNKGCTLNKTSTTNNYKYKVPFYITTIIAICLVIGLLVQRSEYNNLNSLLDTYIKANNSLKKENKSLESKNNSLDNKASNYDTIKNKARNLSVTDFFATQTVLKKPNKARVVFYIPNAFGYEIRWNYSNDISLTTGNTNDGLVYADITYNGSDVGIIECSNSANSSKIIIYCIGY